LTAEGIFFNALPSGGNPLYINSRNDYKFPMLTLYRASSESDLHYPYFGYQTSLDNVEYVDCNAMKESSYLLSSIIAELEGNELI
jgi:aminopeptidase-like protein